MAAKKELRLAGANERGAAQRDMGPRRALGRGLASLIPSSTAAPSAVTSGFRNLPIEKLVARADQPRKFFDKDALEELSHSIRMQGMLQPIVVRREADVYEIVAGERRWRAAMQAGLREIPAIVKDLSDQHCQQVALIENIQRRDLDPIEEAQAYARLIEDHQLTHEALAEAVGKSRVHITHSLRLLKLPAPVLELVAQGKLTSGHVKTLVTLGDRVQIISAAQDFVRRNMSVRDAERYVQQRARTSDARKKRGKVKAQAPKSTSVADVERKLERALGTRVHLKQEGKKKGWLALYYPDLNTLDALVDKLS